MSDAALRAETQPYDPTGAPPPWVPFRADLLRGEVALITGGGSGIGLAAAELFLRLGAKVAICGRNAEKLAVAEAHLRGQLGAVMDPPVFFSGRCDIREPGEVEVFVASAIGALGPTTVLVNNAGGQFPSAALGMSPKGFAAVVNNNLNGTFNMTRAVATAAMVPAKRGAVVNITANVMRGFPGMAHTGAARAGVENLTMSLAVEWAQYGIRVNALAPGIILSSGTQQYPPQILAHGIAATPLKRAGTPEEVAHWIAILASPLAAFMTGAIVRLDGGQAIWGNLWDIA